MGKPTELSLSCQIVSFVIIIEYVHILLSSCQVLIEQTHNLLSLCLHLLSPLASPASDSFTLKILHFPNSRVNWVPQDQLWSLSLKYLGN